MKRFRSPLVSTILALTVAAAALVAQPATAAPAPAAPTSHPVVPIGQGRLAGQVNGRAEEFLGIPYAAPPVGGLRFRPPQQPVRWSETRDATQQAPACPQFSPFGLGDPDNVSEDCLYLDVYRPRHARPGDRLPVLFWIHGGGYSQGTGTQFGGRTMADLTDSVVVSINYRLGQLGYLAATELTRDNALNSGSYGLMDQIAALSWTRANIAAFGGNPAHITLWGQSAGSGSICAMLTSPQATGLFSRAILQSGPCGLLRSPGSAQAADEARAFADAAGCPDPGTRAACLRTAPVSDLITAARSHPTPGPAFGDGLLPAQPSEAIASGTWNKVPVLIGSTRAESRFFVALTQPHLTAREYTDQVNAVYGQAARQVLAHYPVTAYPTPYDALSSVLTDSTFACHTLSTARSFARQVPTYVYEFDDPRSPTLYGAQVPGLDMANAHSAELAYLHDFTMVDRPLTAEQVTLGNDMKRRWAAFARTGDPDITGEARWQPIHVRRHTILTLNPGHTRTSTTFATDHQCDFWDGPATSTARRRS
ncbi:carboxylesterase family protein [Streptomyces sp. ISL-22]|uniref:carboxylesterase/lipase family protein n=1 Tax=unclassified Streptomyces TaxID=2593676 RepID=UPI001BEC1FF3|nr:MULTISPECIES: carboxylesterase family protein [unclassified Streptomyces]MBT2422480.1 carboxylesterase family protein [Streptomyces sp. ISL-24]MBT2436531.1 carboxylesterase family protein [Streptomyces sp. ISL-22]